MTAVNILKKRRLQEKNFKGRNRIFQEEIRLGGLCALKGQAGTNVPAIVLGY
jgi:hypothetical protein